MNCVHTMLENRLCWAMIDASAYHLLAQLYHLQRCSWATHQNPCRVFGARTDLDCQPGTRLAQSGQQAAHRFHRRAAAVRALNSLESVGESMRAALHDLARQDPKWLHLHLDPEWFDRSVHRFEMTRFPKQESTHRSYASREEKM